MSMPSELRWRVHLLRRALGRRELEPAQAEPSGIDPESRDSWRSLDYVHDQVVDQLEAQSDRWDVVDGRLRLILGVIGIVFAAAAAFQRGLASGAAAVAPLQISFWIVAAVVGAVVLFLTRFRSVLVTGVGGGDRREGL
jgi:hypothetical protein